MRTYSTREFSYYRKKKRMPASKILMIIVAVLVVAVGALAIVLITSGNSKLPDDVKIEEFENYLNSAQIKEAVAYWDNALDKHTSKNTQNAINTALGNSLKNFISEGIRYTQNDAFAEDTFKSYYGDLDLFGDRAKTIFEEGIDTLVSAYKQGDSSVTYEKLNLALERLSIFNSISSKIENSKQTLELYREARQKYDEGLKKLDNKEYLDGLALLSEVSNQTELYSKAQEKINEILPTARTAIIEEAKSEANNNKSSKAKKLITELMLYFPNDQELVELSESFGEDRTDWIWTKTVDHLFTHCLVAYPELGFSSSDNSYDLDCITPLEFKRILKALYDNDYVLVDISWLVEVVEEDGAWKKVEKKAVQVPKGKKPFVFSIDDVVYDSKKTGRGMVDKIVIGPDNRIGTTTNGDVDENGNPIIRYDLEVFPILESFIEEYPDFSIDGARGTLALTGFDGILGYRTQSGSPNRESEIAECKKVIAEMKRQGWTFGCHSMNHARMPKVSDESFKQEMTEWVEEVGSLIGEYVAYYYPYGDYVISEGDGSDPSSKTMPTNVSTYSEKHKFLLDQGFMIFNGTGGRSYYQVIKGSNGLYMDRRALDGLSLRLRREMYSDLFDCKEIYDTEARTIPYPTE